MNSNKIRNFCIIAHIDHGKSTLADRFLELTNTVDVRKMRQQTLDSMDLERERGITIKLKAVKMDYSGHVLNLLDTPGHVDFAYEVSRSLAACEGAILVVDASQGIQAQTVSNVYKALEANLTIVPVINKIDLPGAEIEKVSNDLASTFGFNKNEILQISAKTGEGIPELLDQIVERIPPPLDDEGDGSSLRALVFDTFYDDYQGVVALIRVFNGEINRRMIRKEKLIAMATSIETLPEDIGVLRPQRMPCDSLGAGEVGFLVTGLKDIKAVRVGDTITTVKNKAEIPLFGYRLIKPFVFVSIYPVENDQFPSLREALQKLSLSDASLSFEPESNKALGFGFRCGFLGLLHADIIQERLEREYNLSLLSTTPSVEYEITLTNEDQIVVRSPSEYPDVTKIKEVREPWILLSIVTPASYVGGIIAFCEGRRGIQRKMEYPTVDRVIFEYELPLAELVANFFDELKTVSSGFASLDYELLNYKPVKVLKLDILVHGDIISPLSHLVLKDKAEKIARELLIKLKDVIPRQQFQVSLQAAIGGKVIARENISGYRKDVTGKLYGGHRERKDKLLEVQRKGKKRMKRFGKVEIPQEAFRQILKI